MSTDKPTIKFPEPPNTGYDFSQPNFVDDYVARQMEQIQKTLEDKFISETIAKLSSIAEDITHPAHFGVMALLRKVVTEQEKNNAPTST